MKKYILFLNVLLSGLLHANAQDEKKAIQTCFKGYKQAILEDRGKDAVGFVDTKTIQYYSNILEAVKTDDSTKVSNASLLDKTMILSIRHRTEPEKILKMDGKDLLVYAIEQGMVGKNSVMNLDLGDISIENEFAKGQVMVNQNKAPLFFQFRKEKTGWKIDLTSLFPASRQAFEKLVADSGQPENDYLMKILEMVSGKKPTSQVWQPVKK